MTTLTESLHPTESLVSEASGERSRAAILIGAVAVTACMVLGAVQTGVGTATAGTPVSGVGGTVGNGTVSAVTADAGAMAGVWNLVCTVTGSTGKFRVMRPDGSLDGVLTIGTAYNGGINLTVADGSNDWLVDDIIPVTVSYLDGESDVEHEPLDVAGTDGSQIAAAISYGDYAASGRGVAYVRDCEHNADIVKWPTGITADQKALAITQLAAQGIILR